MTGDKFHIGSSSLTPINPCFTTWTVIKIGLVGPLVSNSARVFSRREHDFAAGFHLPNFLESVFGPNNCIRLAAILIEIEMQIIRKRKFL